jgi:hypothetical protein
MSGPQLLAVVDLQGVCAQAHLRGLADQLVWQSDHPTQGPSDVTGVVRFSNWVGPAAAISYPNACERVE